MMEREENNIEKLKEKAAKENKRIVKQYRAFEGDLRMILEDSTGAQERWTLSKQEPCRM